MEQMWLPEESEGGVKGQAKQVKRIKRYKLTVIKQVSQGDEKYSIANTVKNSIITGDRW